MGKVEDVARMPEGGVTMDLTINVLGAREDDSWCAIALEMSLRGYGTTFEQALEELHGAIEIQISFALQHDNLDQIFIPAEPHYCKLYADMKREALKHRLLDGEQLGLPDHRVGNIPLPRSKTGEFIAATA